MSWTRELTFFCAKCGNWERLIGDKVRLARKRLAKAGWVYRGGEDYCPHCTAQIDVD